jgi:hypothetical protein
MESTGSGGEKPELSRLAPDYGGVYHRPEFNRGYSAAGYRSAYQTEANLSYQSMPTISIDAPSASEISQRYNVLVYSLFATGVGHAARSGWDQEQRVKIQTELSNSELESPDNVWVPAAAK